MELGRWVWGALAGVVAAALQIGCGSSAATSGTPEPVYVAPDVAQKPFVEPPEAYQPAEEKPGPQPPVAPDLLAAVSEHPRVDGWLLVPLLQIDAPDLSLVMVWPAFGPDDVLAKSDEVLGFVVARGDRERPTRIVDGPFDATFLTPDDAAARLGSDVFEVRERGAGLELVHIGPRLATRPQLFVQAVDEGNLTAAIDHAVELSRLFSAWTLQDNVGEMLLLAARGGMRMEHLATTAPQGPEGDLATVHLRLLVPTEPPAEVGLQVMHSPDAGGWVVVGTPLSTP